jgi:hypothetical protein
MYENDNIKIFILSVLLVGVIIYGYNQTNISKIFGYHNHDNNMINMIDRALGSDFAFNPESENITSYAANKKDLLSWDILSKANITIQNTSKKNPFLDIHTTKQIKSFDNHDVTITGYMFPLQSVQNMNHFLLSAYPPSCPYCLPAGANELIEILQSDETVFTDKPIRIKGKFHILKGDDLNQGLFYRITNSHII